MSVRENIASNLLSVVSSISSPAIKKATRQPFDLMNFQNNNIQQLSYKLQKKQEMIQN